MPFGGGGGYEGDACPPVAGGEGWGGGAVLGVASAEVEDGRGVSVWWGVERRWGGAMVGEAGGSGGGCGALGLRCGRLAAFKRHESTTATQHRGARSGPAGGGGGGGPGGAVAGGALASGG